MSSISEERFSRVSALKPARKSAEAPLRGYAPSLPEGSDHLARLVGASAQKTRFGEHLALRRWFSDPTPCDVTLDALRLIAPDAPDAAADPQNWLFLDTETTGLAGGTGTYAFLIGIAW